MCAHARVSMCLCACLPVFVCGCAWMNSEHDHVEIISNPAGEHVQSAILHDIASVER